ncbi:hypothetical protein OESDEN_23438 [Oesophagostomum dentatum]|uniref:GPI ethanolamine phosphate transferase 3 n=1 Tax=Oesophagostomum dentatum TaxID=61180 RepID=A0A0B1S0C4_OESDE|nr:hypothetical protein OESDEN_23438 [Oesophagostomum dentatum]
MFTQTYPYDSFDINDLNTVDAAVKELLRDEMTSHSPADLIVAHVLGVDHCGHKYGPNHIQMSVQLRKVFSPGHVLPPLPAGLRQIDLVPTLSLLLGLPIPFSNLGIVVESLFPPHLAEQAVALNFEQVRR